VLGARWSEINLADKTWTIPAERMKSGRPHRVPLSTHALFLLATVNRVNVYIFPGVHAAAISEGAMRKVLLRMGVAVTVHGFRSAFRDWAAETTAYPNHVVEQALAHAIANGVEEAYRRGDLFEKRSRLMQDWSDYCDRQNASAGVTPIRTRTSA
jgi:integrase